MSIKKRLLKNGFASVFQKGVRVFEQLFLVPFFITAWGAAYYGEWLTLTIIPSIIGFSDLGFGTASGNSFILSYAANDKKKAADINKSGIFLITIMVLIGFLISVVTLISLDFFNVFEKSLIDKKDAILAVSILILAKLLMFYMQLIQAYYRSAQKAALSINLQSTYSAISLLGGLIILLLGFKVVEFALSQLIITVLFVVFYYLNGRRILGSSFFLEGKRKKDLVKELRNKGIGYLLSPVWQATFFQGTTFAVRIVLGPEAVAVYNTARTLSRSLSQLFFMIKSAVFPELQFEIGKDNWAVAQKVFRISVLTVSILSIFGFFILAFFGLWFYEIWTKNQLEAPKIMWYLFITGILFNAFWWTTEMVFGAVNKPYKMAKYGLLTALFSIVVTYVGSLYLGLNGAGIGALVMEVILLFLVVPEACRLMRMNVSDIFSNASSDLKYVYNMAHAKLKGFNR